MAGNLPGNGEGILPIEFYCLLIQPVRRFEKSQIKNLTVTFETVANHMQGAFDLPLISQGPDQLIIQFVAQKFCHLIIQARLGGPDEVDHLRRKKRVLLIPERVGERNPPML